MSLEIGQIVYVKRYVTQPCHECEQAEVERINGHLFHIRTPDGAGRYVAPYHKENLLTEEEYAQMLLTQ